MKPPYLHFRLAPDDPFHVKLEGAVKTLRHGTKTPFLINLCKALFGSMDQAEMNETMIDIVEASPETLANLFSSALSRLEVGEAIYQSGLPKPSSEHVETAAKKKKHMPLTALCHQD